MPDPFASGPLATTLAWLATAGGLALTALALVAFLVQKKGMPRPFRVWLVLCLAFLAPARYMLFQLVAGMTFGVQSFSAFFNTFILGLYVPIIFGILYIIGFVIPLGVTLLVLGDEDRRNAGRYVGAAVVVPIMCLLASWLFHLVLPFAAKTVRWLPAEQVIRATNGPAALVFDHIARPFSPLKVPKYFELTPRDSTALRRCHVATLYLSAEQEAQFLRDAYPQVYEEVTSDPREKPRAYEPQDAVAESLESVDDVRRWFEGMVETWNETSSQEASECRPNRPPGVLCLEQFKVEVADDHLALVRHLRFREDLSEKALAALTILYEGGWTEREELCHEPLLRLMNDFGATVEFHYYTRDLRPLVQNSVGWKECKELAVLSR